MPSTRLGRAGRAEAVLIPALNAADSASRRMSAPTTVGTSNANATATGSLSASGRIIGNRGSGLLPPPRGGARPFGVLRLGAGFSPPARSCLRETSWPRGRGVGVLMTWEDEVDDG